MLGFIKLTSGRIIFDGEDITDMDSDQLKTYRRNVQAVFKTLSAFTTPSIASTMSLTGQSHFSLSDNQSEYRDMVEAGLNVVGCMAKMCCANIPTSSAAGSVSAS